METLTQDLKQALRSLRDNPSFTATALAALVLGIGVNTAIFSVLSAVLLRPLPFPEPDRLVLLMQSFRGAPTNVWSSPADVAHWRAQTDVLEDVAAWKTVVFDYTAGDAPLSVRTGTVTEPYFRTLRAPFAAGRGFAPEEDLPGAAKTVVVSHSFWSRRLNGDPQILGNAIPLNGEPHTVIGITRADFDVGDLDLRGAGQPEVWVPLQLEPNTTDTVPDLDALARLKSGVTHEAARQRIAASLDAFRERFPDESLEEWGFTALPLREALVRDARPMLLVLAGAVLLVLLISCANVASLLLVRASGRSREVAIRSALGAGRARIIRQLLTESAALSLAGGALGLLAGALGIRFVLSSGLIDLPRLGETGGFLELDWRVLSFTSLLSIVTGLLVGVAPALASARTDLSAVIKDASGPAATGRRQAKTLSLLVTTEVALAVVLMIGAGLLIRTAFALNSMELGFSVDNVLTMRTALPEQRSTATVARSVESVLARLRAVPGVESAASSVGLPLQDRAGGPFDIPGRASGGAPTGDTVLVPTTADYFETLRIPLLAGRSLEASDGPASPPVAVINQAMADRYWRDGSNPLEDRIRFGTGIPDAADEPARQIVGIVANIRQDGIVSDTAPTMYIPHAQLSDKLNSAFPPTLDWIVRTSIDPAALSAALHNAVREETRQQVTDIRVMKNTWLLSISRQRLNLWLLTFFGAAALLLGAVGVYGLVAYTVAQRRREIGIRMAVGAHADAVKRMIVRQGLVRVASGVAAGTVAAYFLANVLASLLFGVEPHDGATFVLVPLVLLAVGGAAVYVPASRATRIDPTLALRGS